MCLFGGALASRLDMRDRSGRDLSVGFRCRGGVMDLAVVVNLWWGGSKVVDFLARRRA